MEIFGIPAHKLVLALILLGAAQLAITIASQRTTGKLQHRIQKRMGV